MVDIQHFDLGSFKFASGETLSSARLAYAIFNSHITEPVALVPTCFRGRIDGTLNFSDSALSKHRVIVVALFGNGESSAPSNDSSFPKKLDYRDCIHAQYQLVTKGLGVKHLDAVVGFSMGGQTAYYWSLLYPDFVSHSVVICSSARTSRHNYQFLEGPKAALETATDFVDSAGLSHQRSKDKTGKGVQAFGKAYSAWLTSAEWFDQELWTKSGFDTLTAWDEVVTNTGYADWSGDDLLVMLGMWQRGDVTVCAEGAKSLEEALGKIQAKVLLMPCRTDQYFRPEPNERESKSIKNVRVSIIESVWGHIAGGGGCAADTKFMEKEIAAFLSS